MPYYPYWSFMYVINEKAPTTSHAYLLRLTNCLYKPTSREFVVISVVLYRHFLYIDNNTSMYILMCNANNRIIKSLLDIRMTVLQVYIVK